MKQEVNLHAGMGAGVLNYLRMFCDFSEVETPSKAGVETYVAGQAVASAVSALHGDGAAQVYNDVDAFVLSASYSSNHQRGSLVGRPSIKSLQMSSSPYSGMVLAHKTAYDITEVSRSGLLNTIECVEGSALPKENPSAKALAFLQTFDLNCVQVMVRLSDGALIWTPAFHRFMQTRELLVENNKTPLHTAIRWFKKKQELDGIYGHDERAMQALVASTENVIAWGESCLSEEHPLIEVYKKPAAYRRVRPDAERFASKLVFGEAYRDRMEPVRSELSPYFEELELVCGETTLNSLVPRAPSGLDRNVIKGLPAQAVLTYTRAKQGFWKKHHAKHILDILEDASYDASSSYKKMVVSNAPSEVSLDTKRAKLEVLSKKISEHRGIAELACGPAPYEVLTEAIAYLEASKKDWGQVGYGLLDHHFTASVLSSLLSKPLEKSVQETVKEFLEDEYRKAAAQLAQASFLTGGGFGVQSVGGFTVKELRTVDSLFDEGTRLHHCVGGYLKEVGEGKIAIFSFWKPSLNGQLTLELAKSNTRLLGVQLWGPAQFRGLQNRNASQEEKKWERVWVASLNLHRLTRGVLPVHWAIKLLSPLDERNFILGELSPSPWRLSRKSLFRNWLRKTFKAPFYKKNSTFDVEDIPF